VHPNSRRSNKSKRMVGILSLGDLGSSAPANLGMGRGRFRPITETVGRNVMMLLINFEAMTIRSKGYAGVGGGTVATGKRHRRINFLRLSAEPTASPLLEFRDERHRWLAQESCGSRTRSYLVMQVLSRLSQLPKPKRWFRGCPSRYVLTSLLQRKSIHVRRAR
jgi:hypothetical protein